MRGTVYERLFERLIDLIPDLTQPSEGASFYSQPRIAGDIASYCTVSNVRGTTCDVEIAQDAVVNGQVLPAPWMVFRLDAETRVAELLALESKSQYEITDSDILSRRRSRMNAFAFNNLTSLLNLGGAFCAVDVPQTTNAIEREH